MIVFIGILLVLMVIALVISHYECHHFKVKTYEIDSKKLPLAWNNKKLIYLTDLHNSSFGEENKDLLEAIDSVNPEAILIGGDMMVAKEWVKKDFLVCEKLLSALSKKYPIYYGNGNHEQRLRDNPDKYPGWYSEYKNFLYSIGVIYLEDKSIELNLKNDSKNILNIKNNTLEKNNHVSDKNTVIVSGVDIDKSFYNKGFKHTMDKSYIQDKIEENTEKFHILLVHSPRYFDIYAKCAVDLVLSGHLHGGIVRLPFLGGVISTQLELFPKWDRGLFELGKTKMILSGGLGTHSIPVRLFNMPELIVISLKKI